MEEHMENNYLASLKGQFLMAMPGLADPNFALTVTCVCEHTPEGAVGIIINQVHSFLSAKDIFDELKIKYKPETASIPIYLGGPVHMGEIFILHGPPFGWEGCVMITSTLALSNTRDILEAIAMGGGPESLIIALGCAGWGPYQLESEIRQNSWLTSPVSEDIIFDISVDVRWKEAVRKMGIDPDLLSDTAGNA
ncbi:UPF0301 [Desulfonema magnum]|uniref:UPF0301 protein dnm_097270 n=2 Tax=Desulfonema magnum TaxID=45655 RepID=A0A975BXQ8_9BACT|nr:UPF0301 [Desulfonema magnum]